jgi:hypothetical protein
MAWSQERDLPGRDEARGRPWAETSTETQILREAWIDSMSALSERLTSVMRTEPDADIAIEIAKGIMEEMRRNLQQLIASREQDYGTRLVKLNPNTLRDFRAFIQMKILHRTLPDSDPLLFEYRGLKVEAELQTRDAWTELRRRAADATNHVQRDFDAIAKRLGDVRLRRSYKARLA